MVVSSLSKMVDLSAIIVKGQLTYYHFLVLNMALDYDLLVLVNDYNVLNPSEYICRKK